MWHPRCLMSGVKLTGRREHDATRVAVAFGGDATSGATLTVPAAGIDLEAVERALIGFALTSSGGNRTRAARFLGLSRSALLYRVHKYGLAAGEMAKGKPSSSA